MYFQISPMVAYFHGKVVDMFYFPFWQGTLPSWLPFGVVKDFTFQCHFQCS
jgi:signal peptidase II